MEEHPNATLYRRVTEAIAQGDTSAMGDALADDVVWHQIGAPTLHGKEAVLATWEGLSDGVDFDVDLHDVVANDGHLVGLVEAHVKVGETEFTYKTAEILHIEDDKVTERWAFSDDTQAITEFFAQFAG
jgi:ketosteroid isomerase-like protein